MQDSGVNDQQQKNLSATAKNQDRDANRVIRELENLDASSGGQANNEANSVNEDYRDGSSTDTTDLNQLPKIDRFANVATDTDTNLNNSDRDDVNRLKQNA